MTIPTCFYATQNAMREWGRTTELEGSEIIDYVCDESVQGREMPRRSVMPSDLCYNRWNEDLRRCSREEFVRSRLFECVSPPDARVYTYKFRGVGYGYTGEITHRNRGGIIRVIGCWEKGELVEYNPDPEQD